jgi:hypothetical protein
MDERLFIPYESCAGLQIMTPSALLPHLKLQGRGQPPLALGGLGAARHTWRRGVFRD